MYATRSQHMRAEAFAVRPGIAERLGLPYMDGALGFSAVALAVFSVFVLGQTTAQDVPGDPGYFVDRQAIYVGLGQAF